MDAKNKSVASSKEVVPVFTARMMPPYFLKMSPHIEEFIEKRLSKTFEEDPDSYREFIRQWGTHFFQKAIFGGSIRVGIPSIIV